MTEIGGYCPNCGAAWQARQNYCARCGAALHMAGSPGAPGATFSTPVTGSNSASLGERIGAEPAAGNDAPYPREAVLGAVLLTVFMPFIALIAALVLRAQEVRPARRDQLKNWAIASGAWLATGWVIALIVFASVLSAVGPHASGCNGGIDQAVPPSDQSSDGQHWLGTFTCMNGGTITKPRTG